MSSEELKNHLVDLLYDDELDDETRASMRREVENSDEAREDLEQFESMLGMIRESTDEQGPSEDVHASIMEAAREHAENTTRDRAAATERAPRVPSDDENQGIWSRISSHQVTQLALAACALLGAGFLFYLFNMQADESAPRAMSEQSESVEKKVVVAEEPAAEEAEISLDEQEVAQAETEPKEAAEAEESWFGRDSDKRGAKKFEDSDQAAAPEDRLRRPTESKPSRADEYADDSLAKSDSDKRARRRAPAPKKKSAPSQSLGDNKFDPFGDSGADSEASNVFGGTQDPPKAQAQKERDSRSGSTGDNSGVASSLGLAEGSGEQQESEPQPRPAAGASAEKGAAPTEEEVTATDDNDTSGTSVSDVESAYRSGDDKRVLVRADDIIDSSVATGQQKARALELKALSLRRLDRLGDSDRVLSRLQSEYPDYKPNFIQQVRADIARSEREQREAKQRKRKPKKDEQMDMMPETESMDEPAQSNEPAY
jgi:hypothetical protein